jgi:aminopeptidase N
MTDRLAAMQALANSPAPQREAALAEFAREFAQEPLAMDKWFMLQATMHRQPNDEAVLSRVRRLLAHPAFTERNPNKVRALVGSFCNGNLAEFHAADGSGYRFWVEQIGRLDPLNPQVAARVARAVDRWRKFTPERQSAMRAALEEVAALPGLSGDVREIVGKALAA